MKHHRLVTRKPMMAQTNLQSKYDFLVQAYQTAAQLIFGKHGGTATSMR